MYSNNIKMPKKWHDEFREFMKESRRHWKERYPEFRSHSDGDKLVAYNLVEGVVKIPRRYLELDDVSLLTPSMIKMIPSDKFVVKAILGHQGKRVICIHRKLFGRSTSTFKTKTSENEVMYKDILNDKSYNKNLKEVTEYIKKTLQRNDEVKGSALIVEEFLGDPSVGLPMDYKLYVANGKVKLISVFLRRRGKKGQTDEHSNTFDRDWNSIPLNKMYKDPNKLEYIEDAIELEPLPPKKIRNQLIKLAEELAYKHKALFCRYDFYCIQKERSEWTIYFGEITPVCGDLNRYELLETPLSMLYPLQ